MACLPVVHTEESGGQWARPSEALFLDASHKMQPELLEALLREGIPLAGQAMPPALLAASLQIPGACQLSPAAVRARLGTGQLVVAGLPASERTQVGFSMLDRTCKYCLEDCFSALLKNFALPNSRAACTTMVSMLPVQVAACDHLRKEPCGAGCTPAAGVLPL